MKSNIELKIYNSLKGEKEVFKPLNEGRIGLYVCGPTVYNDVHLGNCRTFVSFDVIFRYLTYVGYKVRYVRNVTDVGHLLDDGEDRMAKGARLEQLEPMEVAEKYTIGFHNMMRIFNALPPSIEPRATGHIPEQIEMVEEILNNGFGYEANGSVYFDVPKFVEVKGVYGNLSGRIVEDLLTETRDNLKKQDEKRHPADFAIWMKASPGHLMRWRSPWSVGFPGWHLECSAMSRKYLGETFDIHGGGNDLKFPHHENEIAQNVGACNCGGAKLWMHTNMLLLNGKKMSKSDGNTISPQQLFTGDSEHVTKAYSPMALRFFMLQAHYRSTLDITDDALQAAEKGYKRLMESNKILQGLTLVGDNASDLDTEINALIDNAFDDMSMESNKILQGLTLVGGNASDLDTEINALIDNAFDDMSDDFNAPRAMSRLFELCSKVNAFKGGQLNLSDITEGTLIRLKQTFNDFITNIFGLRDEMASGENGYATLNSVMQLVIDLRAQARTSKDWATSDKIREGLKTAGIQLKDSKEGTSWTKEE